MAFRRVPEALSQAVFLLYYCPDRLAAIAFGGLICTYLIGPILLQSRRIRYSQGKADFEYYFLYIWTVLAIGLWMFLGTNAQVAREMIM